MQINKLNYALIVYLALIEGISLFVLNIIQKYPFDDFSGFVVGFIPAFIVLILYRLISDKFPLKINGKEITKLPILSLSIVNGLFIEALFLIQRFIPGPSNLIGYALFGLLSVSLAALVLILVYNQLKFKISFELNSKVIKLSKINISASFYAGFFEFFILPLMAVFYSIKIPVLLNGLVAGFVGGLIALFIINKRLEKKPLVLF